MAFKVFVSYSSRDRRLVDSVRQALEGPGVEVFVAEHSVRPGESLPAKILAAIKGCHLFVLLWSRHSRVSEWVPQEIGVAKAADRPILPVLLESGLQLPAFLADLKYLPLHDDPQAALQWLRQNILSRVSQKQQSDLLGWAVLAVLGVLVLRSK